MIDKSNLKRIIFAVCVCILAVSVFTFLYHYDNKYTASGSRGMNGTLLLDDTDIRQCNFLVDGWAVYGGVLLTPDDFLKDVPKPDEYVFIGQYGGFEKLTGSPHGSVTYRLVIGIPDGQHSYMLALPEIFSSCRVYVNGREMLALGETDPDSYKFQTGNAVVTFEAAGKIDLLIAVSDFAHLYSGMVYPPAIGSSEAVSHMLNARLVLRSAAVAAALIIGIAALFIGLLGKKRGLAALYGLLCLLFAGYTCYPVIMTLTRGSAFFYAVENISFCAMLLVVIALQNKLCSDTVKTRRIYPYILGLGTLACLAAFIIPLILPHAGLSLMMVYSNLIMAYEWITAGYITVTAGLAVRKKVPDAIPMFWGMLFLDCALVMDRILHSFEPILSGWFPELGSFVLVLSVGVAAGREIIRGYRKNAVLEERVRVIISSGREHYQKMDEMYDKLRILRHDYKYHLNTMHELLRCGNSNEIENYLNSVEKQLSESELQNFCKNSVINALLAGYAERCAKLDIKYDFGVILADDISVPNYEMCIILGNLLENAVEACQKQKYGCKIELVVKPRGEQIAVMVKNSFDGTVIQDKGQPVSAKKYGGLGLRSVQAVAARYGGELFTEWDKEMFTAYVLMRL